MKRFVSFILLCAFALPLLAEDAEHRGMNPHMLRIAGGDQHFEHLGWHASDQPKTPLPTAYNAVYAEHFRYTQHWSLEYQYRHNSWFSYGGMIDGSAVLWDNVTRNGAGSELSRDPNRMFYNIVVMPTIYFTYFHHQYVSMYSGFGVGFDINGGTETDYKGRTTVCAPALNLTAFGVSAWYRSWFASVELGALTSLTDGQHIYLFGSRLFSVAIGVTF